MTLDVRSLACGNRDYLENFNQLMFLREMIALSSENITLGKKGKLVPLQAWSGPEGS